MTVLRRVCLSVFVTSACGLCVLVGLRLARTTGLL